MVLGREIKITRQISFKFKEKVNLGIKPQRREPMA
jgi:hypothetical protein